VLDTSKNQTHDFVKKYSLVWGASSLDWMSALSKTSTPSDLYGKISTHSLAPLAVQPGEEVWGTLGNPLHLGRPILVVPLWWLWEVRW
jgi:hypothetical protein